MAQPRRKELPYELPRSRAKPVILAKAAEPKKPLNELGTHEADDFKEDLRTLLRWAAIGGACACGFIGLAAATGHLWAGIVTLGGLGVALALLISWGSWVLDNTVGW